MQKQPSEQAWKTVLTVVALTAIAIALYLQFFELRARQEEARLSASRLENALAESRTRLKAEILAELRTELAQWRSTTSPDTGPVPNAILRRSEPGKDENGALRQVSEPLPLDQALAISRLHEDLGLLGRQMEESDRALRRDFEELRAATRRESDVSHKATSLILVALIPLVVQLLLSVRRPSDG